jgi:outer membrane protein
MVLRKTAVACVFFCAFCLIGFQVSSVMAAETKVGVMNVQKVLVECAAGVKAKAKFDGKLKEVETTFKEEQDALVALQSEIEKKKSAWSKEKSDEKALEFDKKRREFQTKTESARKEMKLLQDKELQPILKTMEKVVKEYGKKNGYSVILDSKSGIIYHDPANDISADLIKAMDAEMK